MRYRVRKIAWGDCPSPYAIMIDVQDMPLAEWQLARTLSCKDSNEWNKRATLLANLIAQNRFALYEGTPCEVISRNGKNAVLCSLFEPEPRYFFV